VQACDTQALACGREGPKQAQKREDQTV
jgi:hypothetical protein